MAPRLTIVLAAAAATTVSAYAPISTFASRRTTSMPSQQSSTVLHENFGIDFAEDSYRNTDPLLLGEENYKQFASTITDNSFLNRQYNVIRRVRELELLKLTADLGLLSKLEKNGVDLAQIESLLPTLEDLGALSLVGNNQQLLVNLAAPLLIEPAPLLLPVVAGALDVGPAAFFGAAAALATTEVYLLATNAELPLVGLPAGIALGLLLVPLTVVLGGAGAALSAAGSKE